MIRRLRSHATMSAARGIVAAIAAVGALLSAPGVGMATPSTEPLPAEPAPAPAPDPAPEPDEEPVETEPPPEPPVCEERLAEPVEDEPWAQSRLDSTGAWRYTKGADVLVAVIDTGVDAASPFLVGRVLPGFDITEPTWSADWDCNGHGTLVAGIIAGQVVEGTPAHGVSPGVTILPIRQANQQQDGTAGGMADAIRYAVDEGASVINISASAFADAAVLEEAVAYAHAADVVIVASLSNEFENGNPISYPAAYPNVIAVGAMSVDGERADFSETGAAVDIIAPGEDIVAPLAGTDGHVYVSGTSFAAPFVAGTAALVRSAHPHLDADQVAARILSTADHPGRDRPNDERGWGVVNPTRAVTAVLPEESGALPVTRLDAVDPPDRLPTNASDIQRSTGTLAIFMVGGLLATCTVLVLIRSERRSRTSETPATARTDQRTPA